ncbi:MAG: cysteine desulfurase [Rhodocyclaceae bacterium]
MTDAGTGALRAAFPLLAANPGLHYLDNAATAQICAAALDAVVRHETRCRANVLRGTHRLAEAADAAYRAARASAARFLGAADAQEIVFTSGATASLNLLAHSLGETLREGDEILLSVAEHHANLLPWQRLRSRGIRLRFLPIDGEGRLDLTRLPELVGERCRLIALTHCSNVTGAITDLPPVVAAAKAAGALVALDGAQAVQHGPVDVHALGVDFYAFSGHKCFGPNGIGVLWGRREALEALPPFLTGGGMVTHVDLEGASWAEVPRRFEAGTPPIAQAVALGAALEWMMTLSWSAIRAREASLAARLIEALARLPGVRLLGPQGTQARAPIVSFHAEGIHPHDLVQMLDEGDVAVRGGHHCARPLMAALGVDACTRASLALYNDVSDIDALLEAMARALSRLR